MINTKASAPKARVVSAADQAATLAKLIAEVPAVTLSPAAIKELQALNEIPRAAQLSAAELVDAVLGIAWNFLKAVDSSNKFAKPVLFMSTKQTIV